MKFKFPVFGTGSDSAVPHFARFGTPLLAVKKNCKSNNQILSDLIRSCRYLNLRYDIFTLPWFGLA